MLESLAVAQCFFLQFVVKQVRWSVTPTDLISNFCFFFWPMIEIRHYSLGVQPITLVNAKKPHKIRP